MRKPVIQQRPVVPNRLDDKTETLPVELSFESLDDFTPANLVIHVEGLRKLLDSPDAHAEAVAGLAEVRKKLGPGGAIERAADIFVGML